MTISFERVDPVVDGSAIERFLTTDTWPFHSAPTLSGNDVANMSFRSHAVDSYWIVDGGRAVGLVRLLELDDIEGEGGDGSPIFDLRVGAADRGRGLGTMAVAWLTGHLFTTYPRLHRVEAHDPG